MYKIKYNDTVICTPQFKEFAAIAGKLQEGLNAVSVFSFTLPPKHLYFDSIEGRNGLVKLYDDDNVLFIGDIVNRKENFDCTTEIECQDALGWLNDVVFVKPTFSGAIENYWAYLLGRYNQEASEWRKINIGTVTVQGNISINHDTEFLTIFDLVSELTKLSGGYVSVRYEGEEIFLDYLAQANTESDQSILFGTNLINLEDFVSEEQIFSRIYPRGKDGLDISSVNDGLTYLTNGITESMFGIVAVTVDFDTESATELKALGQAYLEANGLASRTLTLTAFDLSLVDKKYTEIKVGNIVPVISPLHGINTKMQVNAKTTDIVTPENSTFTLGLILNTISGIMASGGGTSKTISAGAVYPVEEGDANNWHYVKWNNGYAECWCTLPISNIVCYYEVGNWYRSEILTPDPYPFTFTETPNLQMFYETDTGAGGIVWPAGTDADDDPTARPHKFYIIRMTSSNSISGKVHFQVKGKWE